MRKRTGIFNSIRMWILLVLLILFAATAIILSVVNNRNIRRLYEDSYTEQLLLTNALMGTFVNSDDIAYFVDLLKLQNDGFKQRQVDFYHDREELFRLQREGGSEDEQQEILNRLAVFHAETEKLKNDTYWETLAQLKTLKEVSNSTYVYVMADLGLKNNDGETLFTFIFDAEDEGEYNSPDMDGLGTSDIGNEAFTNVFLTKKQTEKAEHYEGDYGELYFVCVPIIGNDGEVIAVLGTDLALDDMNNAIVSSTVLFNSIIITVFVISCLIVFLLFSNRIARPLVSLTNTTLAFAQGNLNTPISQSALKQRTEIGTLAGAIKSTLDATTLYLNCIPESIFIMSRDCETTFRNSRFIKRFGNMQAKSFIKMLFPDNTEFNLEQCLSSEEGSTSIVWIDGSCFAVLLNEIDINDMTEKSILVIANDITDLMIEKENAQAAAAAKTAFLSRMSHEMRTPMNAIIGMSKVAGDSDSLSSIRHCISVINTSSEQLLSIINDVLDMSKIEAGKLELETVPMNLEKTFMKVCGIIIDSVDKKQQRLNVNMSRGLKMHYIADELRLSQVLTNLLSNAVKFTPEGGTITLSVENESQDGNSATLRFSVADTGIGMTPEQISRLFNAFEQADGSISRRFGGTGLGLSIAQSIVEKMGGRIEVASTPGTGTTFSFTVTFEYAPHQDSVIFDSIRPKDLKLLIIEEDDDIRSRFAEIVDSFGITADIAGNAQSALELLDAASDTGKVYDIIFLSYEFSDINGIDMINQCRSRIDKNSVIIITTYLEWQRIESRAADTGITRYITKPVFPSSVLDIINEVVGSRLKELDIKTEPQADNTDLSNVRLLLAEDIDINREIFVMLLEDTGVQIDIAENGLAAVKKFTDNPELYDLIIMDIQMPEMDGFEATRTIRAMKDVPRASTIPIVAMSANAFKEDVEQCLSCGMNDHLAKPIDVGAVIAKIVQYTK